MEEKEYKIEDAAVLVSELISEDLSNKLCVEDIYEILETEFEWMLQNNLTRDEPFLDIDLPPTTYDEDSMQYFIINQCVKKDIILTYDELNEILAAEIEYLRSIGLIDENEEERQRWEN